MSGGRLVAGPDQHLSVGGDVPESAEEQVADVDGLRCNGADGDNRAPLWKYRWGG